MLNHGFGNSLIAFLVPNRHCLLVPKRKITWRTRKSLWTSRTYHLPSVLALSFSQPSHFQIFILSSSLNFSFRRCPK